ncbi:hypothetical protein EDD90_3247 [Streptomyces sp. Ag109_O5-1]|uniref:hypothetical protein n=1 Tax=Streptomyces sp. Ag109_O5-1 TaxID=1938851 RepID=UPI000F4F5F6A|nr:hypothetical protein [Streptomyces sp. Ag109_O5-1]RPE40211.1 hypothetical protein EDD90_3247 [Streptomyces sp. Ag109_O5-1]
MADLATRRGHLLAAIRQHGRPVTTQLAEQLLTGAWPTYGRNTARKDLRGLARAGLLTAADVNGRRVYHPTSREVGPPVTATRHIQPSPDTERVLGQIERGEIRCGRDAAREIAARHQAAYGDEVWPDSAWAAALASLPASAKGGNA